MQCQSCRDQLSARIDGEGGADAEVDRHLAGCTACRTWLVDVAAVGDRLAPALAVPVPDRTAPILAALNAEQAELDLEAERAALFPWRVGLAAIGIIQLLLAVPVFLFGAEPHAGVHVAHEMGSFDVALAVGFLFAAWRPARAWGMLPLVAALGACLALTTVVDMASGRAGPLAESAHLLDVLGLVLLWALAHTYRRPTPARTRLATS